MTSALDDSAPVVTRGLTKRFRRQIAVDRIDLEVPDGAVYGFLGPNGSGKTTTIRMLLGLISPTAGDISLLGSPMPAAARTALRRIGSLVEGPAFHPYLSGRANLARLDAADRYSDPRTSRLRIDAALDRVGLLAAAEKRYRAYSLGMRQEIGDRELAVDAARPAGAGRAHQRARPAGHSGGPAPYDRTCARRCHGAGLQPPARRGGADLQPCRGDARGPAGGAGTAERASRQNACRRYASTPTGPRTRPGC